MFFTSFIEGNKCVFEYTLSDNREEGPLTGSANHSSVNAPVSAERKEIG